MNAESRARAVVAIAALRDVSLGGVLSPPPANPRRIDREALREVLVRAVCPIVCRGYLDGGENWHQICLDRADSAMAALDGAG